MKLFSTIAALLVVLAWSTACQAGVIGVAAADGDGAIECTGNWVPNPAWTPETALTVDGGTMTVDGVQHGAVGHVGTEDLDPTACFLVNTDPTVKLRTTIDNDTTFAWTGYNVDVYMNQPFTLSLPTVYAPDTSVPGWGVASYVATAVQVGSKWEASVYFAGGTPIPVGGTLDFSYKLTFNGSVNYCQQMTPVPEPTSIALAMVGLVGLLVVRRKVAR